VLDEAAQEGMMDLLGGGRQSERRAMSSSSSMALSKARRCGLPIEFTTARSSIHISYGSRLEEGK